MILIDVYIEDSWIENNILTYTYTRELPQGIRVLVPVLQRERVGFVINSYHGEVDFEVRDILAAIDDQPIISKELWDLAHWMSEQTLNPIIRCFQAILPNVLRPSSSFESANKIRMIRVLKQDDTLTKRQQEVVSDLLEKGTWTYSQGLQAYKSVLRTLINKGIIEEYEIEQTYDVQAVPKIFPTYPLTNAQTQLIERIKKEHHQVYLIHGPTGSGKTEIYLHVAQNVLNTDRQVLILVPEISLTPQMIERFQNRFGLDIGIYHSGLNNQEKYQQYLRVKSGEVKIVVGTRSAVFLPFQTLGLIVMDEEHDESFKQESAPYYHARDVAIYRGQIHNCPVVLGSASPSLESYARAYKQVYTLLNLPNRRSAEALDIEVVNTSLGALGSVDLILSEELVETLSQSLERQEQSILLLNRRSYAPLVYCPTCHTHIKCPHCERALSYHQVDQTLRCHTCDYVVVGHRCPVCYTRTLSLRGIGTQRLQEVVQQRFPQARLARMDTDTTRRKNAHFKILNRFMNHEVDILVGTQMIAKGLDNPKVTCVGILNADSALMHEDFSSSQRAFNLILQASGRAGRADLPGKVVIQTFNPHHYALKAAIQQDYHLFFQQEMRYRHMANYPPYTYLIEVRFSHQKLENALEIAHLYKHHLMEDVNLMGPAVLSKIRNIEPVRLVLRGKDLNQMRQFLQKVHNDLFSQRKGVRVIINVNPLHLSG